MPGTEGAVRLEAGTPAGELVNRVRAGDRRAIARLLSHVELRTPHARDAMDQVDRAAGRAQVVGITGVPGSGKSTLVAKLAAEIRKDGRKVGIVAVDPSSPWSGGSVLGDRVRMNELTKDDGVFIRSMASRGALGGLARGTHEAVDILDAGGFEVVIIETVGVGQDAVDIVRAAHTTVVVSPPGLGDEVQAVKAGLLEVADIHAVSKSDKPEARRTVADLKGMLLLARTLNGSDNWQTPVIPTSSLRGEGIAELLAALDAHRDYLVESGEITRRRLLIRERRMLKAAEQILHEEFQRQRIRGGSALLEQLASGELSPHAGARRLLAAIGIRFSG